MKKPTLISALLLALPISALVVGQPKSKESQAGGLEQQLKQMEDDWQKAIKNKEAATLRRIIAEDWVGTDDKGKILNRELYISQTTSNADVIESTENFDMQVRVYGNTAVVTGGSKEKGTRSGT